MRFEIFIPDRSHLQELVRIKQRAFCSFQLFRYMMPIDDTETMEQYYAAREEIWYNCANQKVIAVRDSATGKAVAWSRWSTPSPDNPDTRSLVPPPQGTNLELYQAFRKLQKERRNKYAEQPGNWEMLTVATDPDFEGRGCGKLMLQHITNLADEACAGIDLWASPAGMPLYAKFAFQVKDEIFMDLTKYDGPEIAKVLTWMARTPRALPAGVADAGN